VIRIDIRPVWRFRSDTTEREFDFQLVAILGELDTSGKLTQAAQKAGISYRHAWNLVTEWEEFFGAPLVVKERGRGSTLTPLGERLLWAGRRAQASLAPELENLAAEFARSLNESLHDRPAGLVMQASHDFAIGALREIGTTEGIEIELQYKGSFDALAALRRGECDVAGFHVPQGKLGELMAKRYAECLPLEHFRLISFVRRSQGLMVKSGNPKDIQGVADLCRNDVRMVNRQRGSGTRALLEFLISSEGLDRARMHGYDNEEVTHGAVAALIAGKPGRRWHRRASGGRALSPRIRAPRGRALLPRVPRRAPRDARDAQPSRLPARQALRTNGGRAARLCHRTPGRSPGRIRNRGIDAMKRRTFLQAATATPLLACIAASLGPAIEFRAHAR
jgi:molybdate transport repressor ModE-like protein